MPEFFTNFVLLSVSLRYSNSVSNSGDKEMISKVKEFLNKRFPKNFILNKPLWGTLILTVFQFFFLVLYKPFHVHGARSFSFEFTMVLYVLVLFIPVFSCLLLLKRLPYFSNDRDWTLIKEILSIIIILFVVGITVYFAGFLIEAPANRWNFSTFLDSLKTISLIAVIPILFFTISNYRYLFSPEILQFYKQSDDRSSPKPGEDFVHISSQLKKEELSFYISQFLYAESDGNYVVFHLIVDGQYIKKIIRNSINDIELQLSSYDFVMRIHRAFIVNLKKVLSKKGNTLGYRLKLSGTNIEISVSRNNTRNFDHLMKQFM